MAKQLATQNAKRKNKQNQQNIIIKTEQKYNYSILYEICLSYYCTS